MKKIDLEVIGGAFIFAVVFAMIIFFAAAGISNARNRISEGVVVDKEVSAGYMNYSADGKRGSMQGRQTAYYLKIEGEKNGKTVAFWREVSESEYEKYNIGDWYGSEKGGKTWK